MLTNLNIRVLGNDHIIVQYSEEGKAHDAGFSGWAEFIVWLDQKVNSTYFVADLNLIQYAAEN